MESPVRARPGWTSSAMYSPPAAWTTSTAFARKPGGSANTPSEEKIESAIIPANPNPPPRSSPIARRTPSANAVPTSPPSCRYPSGGGTVRTWAPNGTAGPYDGEISAAARVFP